ncbi:MAG: class I SAM-dependent methyltransferase [Elusimicrobia bacterium]|nr:class I SAM-dependent methyltransferase [Elusimicrobiota bacterium]
MKTAHKTLRSSQIDNVEQLFDYLMIEDTALLAPASRLHEAAEALGCGAHADLLRMDICHRLRLGQDAAFASSSHPAKAYGTLLEAAAECLEKQRRLPLERDSAAAREESLFEATTKHYGSLWGDFSPAHYYEEAFELLSTRLRRNGIDLDWFKGKRALDCGCGGGRYTVALKKLGLAEVVGCDGSSEAIAVARQRAAGTAGVSYVATDVLKLPFKDGEFDLVFSNGVLHHTEDTARGLAELARVMKPAGRAWIYLYARPGGLDRLTHYLARLLLRSADRHACQSYCRSLGLPGHRIFFLLDLWLTPVAECYTPEETEAMLSQEWRTFRRLERGSDQDLVEAIHGRQPHARAKFGVGENRYWAEGRKS